MNNKYKVVFVKGDFNNAFYIKLFSLFQQPLSR
jgi:hypothetical protein